ncbi:MAG: quinol:cytochrome C oxidoreductase [Deltaproteobacteria bacterium]|nr:quinol:cytochrome C oxidoreductase [Deltaproteobacteria bacterium]
MSYRLEKNQVSSVQKKIGFVFILSSLCLLVGLGIDAKRVSFNYLLSFCFLMSLGLGGLFLTMLWHVTSSRWSVLIRRIPETFSYLVMVGLGLAIALFMALNQLYPWSQEVLVQHDKLLSHKALYLNNTFFILRTILYFFIWILLYRKVIQPSLHEDTHPTAHAHQRMFQWSAVGLVLFGFTITFAAIDWMMTLKAQWFSTIYGVYYFSGTFVAILASTILAIRWFQSKGHLTEVTEHHFHDLGKLLYAINIFWAYIAFSQFMLMWYGNIPEETVFYADRNQSAWPMVSMLLIAGHFILPFFFFMSRHAKRNRWILGFSALWLLIMHYVDLFWLIMPNLSPKEVPLGWLEVVAFFWVLSLIGLVITFRWKHHAYVPVCDPHLKESLEFHQL